ncbi:MAG: 4-(cytidine 5'-diphospho)-2-C-methyl-D-erythritol kinase [Treponema sp.]|jgi:4-diphosphocytidyl-2-C-methyl-D-erythritol kinase|nr:4-(cytidine 5'-diphospho)-2-C-methyl-D-erythritol kinase [Treponema sp.]
MEKALHIEAPCKINLHLHVQGRRFDGYHSLESIFLALNFGDTLRFFPVSSAAGDVCIVRWDGPAGESPVSGDGFKPEENIVLKAAALFRARTGFDQPVRVELDKRIPLGGGLGGGSSDAAAVLRAFNTLAGTALAADAMVEMAEELGSDVPFFLDLNRGPAALVSGRGEYVLPLGEPPPLWVVLVNPGFSSGTAAAFRLLDEAGGPAFSGPSGEALAAVLREEPRKWSYSNDFLPVFLAAGAAKAREAYSGILRDLKVLGAEFIGLSGTGATCFGIFTSRDQAIWAEIFLKKFWSFVQLTVPLRVQK